MEFAQKGQTGQTALCIRKRRVVQGPGACTTPKTLHRTYKNLA